jgi:D-inositol-3-phosphate glycosyltransferase
VGGLRTAVRDGVSGLLIDGHSPVTWARAVGSLLADPQRRQSMATGGVEHAREFGWSSTASQLVEVYSKL